jgi:hypothetical protein
MMSRPNMTPPASALAVGVFFLAMDSLVLLMMFPFWLRLARAQADKKPTAVASRGFLLNYQFNKRQRRRPLRRPAVRRLVNSFST